MSPPPLLGRAEVTEHVFGWPKALPWTQTDWPGGLRSPLRQREYDAARDRMQREMYVLVEQERLAPDGVDALLTAWERLQKPRWLDRLLTMCAARGLLPGEPVRRAELLVIFGDCHQWRATDPAGDLVASAYREAHDSGRSQYGYALRDGLRRCGAFDVIEGAARGHVARVLPEGSGTEIALDTPPRAGEAPGGTDIALGSGAGGADSPEQGRPPT